MEDIDLNIVVVGVVGLLLIGGLFIVMQGDESQTDGDEADTTDQSPTSQPGGDNENTVEVVSDTTPDTTVVMENTQFQSSPQVSKGTVVKFVNQDSYTHTVTINGESIDKQVPGGSSATLRFNEAGSYNIVCTLHSGMETPVNVSG